jgi:uncharacterized repeat protein (TIGR03803 family)
MSRLREHVGNPVLPIHKLRPGLIPIVCVSLIMMLAQAAHGQSYKVLHNFNPNNGDGYFVSGGLALDGSGNVYGTAAEGGLTVCPAEGCGVVFELSPNADGTWSEALIHLFDGVDGGFPAGPVVFDSRGNLYGTAADRGTYQYGAIFELTPGGRGTWSERTLHQFTGGADGAGNPGAGLVFDHAGNLYGSSLTNGSYGKGVVFAMTGPLKSNEVVLHSFTGGSDGANPTIWLIPDASGNLYGTAGAGGTGYGLVFELSPGHPGWTESILHSFVWQDGITPYSGVVADAAGNLYGTSFSGGARGEGLAFRLTRQADGSWTPTVIYSFYGYFDGAQPVGPLTIDHAGNLYGTTSAGGLFHAGTVFKLTPSGDGHWTETVPDTFNISNGSMPLNGVTLDAAGNIYGTTQVGGAYGGGVVFELTAP